MGESYAAFLTHKLRGVVVLVIRLRESTWCLEWAARKVPRCGCSTPAVRATGTIGVNLVKPPGMAAMDTAARCARHAGILFVGIR